jgi:hypothetical protein
MFMQQPRIVRSVVARLMMGCMLLISGLAQAAPVSTSSLIAPQSVVASDADREKLMTLIQRDDIAEQLSAFGVDPIDAQMRVADMSAAEVADLNQQIDSLPAGAGVLGAVVLIFIVFIITDMLGATNIFNFVHPVR